MLYKITQIMGTSPLHPMDMYCMYAVIPAPSILLYISYNEMFPIHMFKLTPILYIFHM